MIRINFAKRLSHPLSTGASGSGGLQNVKVDKEFLMSLPLGKIALLFVAFYLSGYGIDEYKIELLQKEDVQIEELEAQKAKINVKLQEQKSLEQLKLSLEKDDAMVRAKLDAIKALMKDRDVPARVLLEFSKIMPEQVWIKTLSVDEKQVSLSGSSIGFNPLSDFMKNIRSSQFFSEVTLKSSQSVQDRVGELTNFDLSITRRSIQ